MGMTSRLDGVVGSLQDDSGTIDPTRRRIILGDAT
jgi:hypothetical protein